MEHFCGFDCIFSSAKRRGTVQETNNETNNEKTIERNNSKITFLELLNFEEFFLSQPEKSTLLFAVYSALSSYSYSHILI